MPELETSLAREREQLLDSIEQPPLELVGARAARIRRRRRAARAGAALAVVAALGFVGMRPWSTDAEPKPPPVAEPSPGVVYTDSGITINGLTGQGVLDLDGWVTDVAFADPDNGYVLARCADGQPACPPSVARSTDGGITWRLASAPPVPDADADLAAFPDGRVVLGGYVSTDGAQTWQAVARTSGPAATIGEGHVLRLGDGAVEVLSSMYGNRGELVNQPDLTVKWVAGAPTATGEWWVGGARNDRPAVAVTRDSGRGWEVREFGAPGATAQVSVLGARVFVTVLGAGREITAIYRSDDAGRQFTPVTEQPVATPSGLAGEVVPLLDGRLLAAGTDQRWYVSEDDGRTFTQAEGNLPKIGRIVRTPAGCVAYDLFDAHWTAFSADGSTWRKLQVY